MRIKMCCREGIPKLAIHCVKQNYKKYGKLKINAFFYNFDSQMKGHFCILTLLYTIKTLDIRISGSATLMNPALQMGRDLSSNTFPIAFENGTLSFYRSSIYNPRVLCDQNLTSFKIVPFNSFCWAWICKDTISIGSITTNISDTKQISGLDSSSNYTVAFPFMDIHTGTKLISCNWENFIFDCQEFIMDTTNYKILSSNGYTFSVKVVTYNNQSMINIYGSNPLQLRINETIYAVTQSDTDVYVWADSGLYSSSVMDANASLQFQTSFGFLPINDQSMMYIGGGILYLTESSIEAFDLATGNSSTISEESFDRIYDANTFLLLYNSQSYLIRAAIVFPTPTHTTRTTINYSWTKMEEYSWAETNETSNENQTEKISFVCWEGCKRCFDSICLECSSGYDQKDSQCVVSESLALGSSLISFPYATIAVRFILLSFMEEFWYYQFHDYNYSSHVQSILQFVGNVNRKKFIPAFIVQIFDDLHDLYQKSKSDWGFSDSKAYTDETYHQIEKEPINFTVSTSKMYLWNYLFTLIIYFIQRFLYCIFSKNKILRMPFERSSTFAVLFMVFIESHVQYIAFTFFMQLKNFSSMLVFMDKVNLIICVMFGFITFFYALGSFTLFRYFMKKSKFKILFPISTGNQALDMLVTMFLGPGRSFLLGAFQTFFKNFTLQVFLLLLINFSTFLVFRLLKRTNYPKYLIIFKLVFLVCVSLFLLAGLLKYHNLAFSSDGLDFFQLFCIASIWAMCIMDFFFGFTVLLINLGNELLKKISKNGKEKQRKTSLKRKISAEKKSER